MAMLASRSVRLPSDLPATAVLAAAEAEARLGEFDDVSQDLRRLGVEALRFRMTAPNEFCIVPIGLQGTGRTAVRIEAHGRVAERGPGTAGSVIEFTVGDVGSFWGLVVILLVFLAVTAYQVAATGRLDSWQAVALFAIGAPLLTALSWLFGAWQVGRTWPGLQRVALRIADGTLRTSPGVQHAGGQPN